MKSPVVERLEKEISPENAAKADYMGDLIVENSKLREYAKLLSGRNFELEKRNKELNDRIAYLEKELSFYGVNS